ncbi:MAG TPA: type VI secretion system baseplate subunit TssG [Amaricoccus sp.]|nr:type VI secretion system baseplate subunit TssG [Amaricoccus sp.]
MSGASLPDAEAMDFFELLRRLEREGRFFGRGGLPDREPARLGQELRLGFAVRDVAGLAPATERTPARVSAALFGLFGPEGPMPLHISRWMLDRLAQRWFTAGVEGATSDRTFLDFTNALQHRMLAFFYRSWADQTPAVQEERPAGGRMRTILAAIAGAGGSSLRAEKLDQAAALGHQVLGPERLAGLVEAAVGAPVAIEEFVGAWTEMPRRLQTRLGAAHAGLGRGASIGPRVFSRQSRMEIRVGPLALADYVAFLPGGARLETLRKAVLHGIGEALDVDFRPILRASEVPKARIGGAAIGRTGWLAPTGAADAGDLRLRAIVGLTPEGERAVA